TETGRFNTPERRAGLEARINELTTAIGDEAVRRYYRQDLFGRLRDLTAPTVAAKREAADRRGTPGRRDGRDAGRPAETRAPLSPQLRASPIVRGSRSSLPAREALILLAALNHPWLLEAHAEELADLEFVNSDADTLRRVVLDLSSEDTARLTRETLRQSVV